MSNSRDEGTGEDTAHLDDVPDGVGCAEIWERLSARRAAEDDVGHRKPTREQLTQEGR